ncbi:MAG: hypothetical protein INR73_20315 [Williamsia sp.]|nr:hypothetical protein [Williamsia sp.]
MKITALISGVLLIAYLFVSTSFPFAPDRKKGMNRNTNLLQTHLKQMGGFLGLYA